MQKNPSSLCIAIFFAVAPDVLMETVVTHKNITVKWNKFPRCEKCSHNVTAVDSQGAVHNCSVKEAQMAAICENLSPCMEYNITVRACGEKSGCGDPATKTASTKLGRKSTCITSAVDVLKTDVLR